jgi:hypothetical protein
MSLPSLKQNSLLNSVRTSNGLSICPEVREFASEQINSRRRRILSKVSSWKTRLKRWSIVEETVNSVGFIYYLIKKKFWQINESAMQSLELIATHGRTLQSDRRNERSLKPTLDSPLEIYWTFNPWLRELHIKAIWSEIWYGIQSALWLSINCTCESLLALPEKDILEPPHSTREQPTSSPLQKKYTTAIKKWPSWTAEGELIKTGSGMLIYRRIDEILRVDWLDIHACICYCLFVCAWATRIYAYRFRMHSCFLQTSKHWDANTN